LKGVASGSAQQIKVSYDTAKLAANMPSTDAVPASVGMPPVTAPPTAMTAVPPVAVPVTMTPPIAAVVGTTPPTGNVVPLGVPGMVAPVMNAPPPPPPGPAPAGGPARVSIQPSAASAALNAAVSMTIYAENVVNMADVAAQLQYDPKILRATNIVVGDLPGRNLAPLQMDKNVLDDIGRADMRVSRGANGGTISGAGALFTVVFQAVGRGSTSVALSSFALRGPDGAASVGATAPATVAVQ
jgi:hypothetical protein